MDQGFLFSEEKEQERLHRRMQTWMTPAPPRPYYMLSCLQSNKQIWIRLCTIVPLVWIKQHA